MTVESGSFASRVVRRPSYGQHDDFLLSIEGGYPLNGDVPVSGAKNAVLKLMAAALLTSDVCTIRNVPQIGDVFHMIAVLEGLGCRCELDGDVLRLQAKFIHGVAPKDPVKSMRASVQVMGPLLARLGEVHVAHPGGCAIGPRPIDLHLAGFEALGAEVEEGVDTVRARARQLAGAEIRLAFPSVGATENIMMAAVKAKGVTVITNAAQEPEIVDLQNFLNLMGARVEGAGTDTIRIQGVASALNGADYTVMPDRIEAATWATMVAAAGGNVTVAPVVPDHVAVIAGKLHSAGCDVQLTNDGWRVRRTGSLKRVDVRSEVYPGFPTDMQPPILALLTLAEGVSVVTETVYASRYKQVGALQRMGADIAVHGRVAIVKGVKSLQGMLVRAPDLRAGAALVVAAVAARGTTTIDGVSLIDRGYENIVDKLVAIGGKVQKVLPAEAVV